MTVKTRDADLVLGDLGRRVAELRVEKGLTQEQFAEQVGWSVTYLQRIEAGRANLTVRSLVALAALLRVDLGSLFAIPFHRGKPLPGRPKTKF